MEEKLNFIQENYLNIINNIEQENFDVYCFLKEEFSNTDVSKNYLFQFVFRNFYRLDNAGLSNEFKVEYFNLMQELRNEKNNNEIIRAIFIRLNKFDNKKGQKSFQLSFVTKMLHTMDNNFPIYDSEVASMLNIRNYYDGNFEKKLIKSILLIEELKNKYDEIIQNNLLSKPFQFFDKKFENNKLTKTKKLDFIIWKAGNLFHNKKNIFDYWNVILMNGIKIRELDHPAKNWLYLQIGEILNPKEWILQRNKGLLKVDIESINQYCLQNYPNIIEETDGIYHFELTVRSLLKDCIDNLNGFVK
jgi:hypothetical protein